MSWNTADLLALCLTSLDEHTPPHVGLDVVVVDNASTDGSVELVRERWPSATLLANETNVGYQRANNQAIPLSSAEFLLLINADAVLEPECLGRLVDHLVDNPRTAIVAPRLVYGDGRWQRWTAGAAPDLWSVASYFLFLERVSSRFADRSLYLARDVDEPTSPDWVSSACMLVRTAAIQEVGMLDERYFCYMDDVDLCERVRSKGWRVVYEPRAECTHFMGESSMRQTGSTSPAAIRNFNDYFEQRHGRARCMVARLIEACGFGARSVGYLARSLRSRDADDRAGARAHLLNSRRAFEGGRV